MLNFALAIHTQMSRGQEGGGEVNSEPALRLKLLQGLRAVQGGGNGRAKSLKDGVICTVVVIIEQGSITDFHNWRLTYSEIFLIPLKTNHLESKEYIAYLCHRNTLCR